MTEVGTVGKILLSRGDIDTPYKYLAVQQTYLVYPCRRHVDEVLFVTFTRRLMKTYTHDRVYLKTFHHQRRSNIEMKVETSS